MSKSKKPLTPMEQTMRDVALAVHSDRSRPATSVDVQIRFRAFLDCRKAVVVMDEGSPAAYRGTLIDLASACIRVAALCPPMTGTTPLEVSQIQAVNKLTAPVKDELAVAA